MFTMCTRKISKMKKIGTNFVLWVSGTIIRMMKNPHYYHLSSGIISLLKAKRGHYSNDRTSVEMPKGKYADG